MKRDYSKHGRGVGKISVLLLSLFLSTGCSTMKVTEVQTAAPETYTNAQEKQNLSVAVQPFTERAQVDKTFRTDLLKKGLLPILIVVENRNPSASFILEKQNVRVVDAAGASSTSQSKKVSSETVGGATAVAGAAAISLPLVLAGLKMASDATVIQHNLADKEFYSRTLAPGQKTHGFVYFQFPPGTDLVGTFRIVVDIVDSSSGQPTVFEFPTSINLTNK